ncbi:MAG: hypothetical protein JNK15_08475 [Planctomycetes bacterium]|nr:hypothetical protein [Planctomycetota bacterium]
MLRGNPRHQAGFTFAELAFGFLILVVSAAVLVNHLAVNYQTTSTERDRVFAFAKCQAMLSEIQTYVDRGELEAVDLDVLDDGVTNKATLSIQEDSTGTIIAPDHVVSGNMQRDGQWLWWRRITVQPFAGVNNRNVRYVTVRVYRRDNKGEDHALADLSAVVNSAGEAFPATQVLDIYLLAIDNIPGWWVFMDSIQPFVESMLTDLETRNPGLEFRSHWITKAAYGRNPTYRPYTNDETDSYAVIPGVYHYPGKMPSGSASAYYYVPDNMRARINCDGTERNGYDSDLNPYPYSMADFFNHAMRYPDELALWQAKVAAIEAREAAIAAAQLAGTTPPAELTDMSKEPTYRILLEQMNTDPNRYKNALVVNLHGELLPMPAIRNYSDAARSPITYPNLRVVTHPEELRTKNKQSGMTDPLRFRCYAYNYRTSASAAPSIPAPTMADPMVVEVVGINLTDASAPTRLRAGVTLQNLPGGLVVDGTSNYATTWQTAAHELDSRDTLEMYYKAEWVPPDSGVDGFTRVYLFNTPTSCPSDGTGRGLPNSSRARLYEMEYVPCPTVLASSVPSFTGRDLTSTDTLRPKNTARWTLELDSSVLTGDCFVHADGSGSYNPPGDVTVQVRTRIATGYSLGDTGWQSSGTAFGATPSDADNIENLSVTYAWWTDQANDVPITERSQFNGDPRHLPYKDCFTGGDDFPKSYNWYHDDLNNNSVSATGDVTSISVTELRDHWGASGSLLACDAARYYQLLREGLIASNCVYTTLTGWSYYYLGIGNDIGYDSANGYANSIPSNQVPHGSTGNGYINTITTARKFVRQSGSNYWWGMPWLGELAPDALYASQWVTTSGGVQTVAGNLTAGTSSNQFYQQACRTVYSGSGRQAYGTYMYDSQQRTASYGCTSFFNIGTSASTFQHWGATANYNLTTTGTQLANNYNMTVPSPAPFTRPFKINMATGVAQHWSYAPYDTKNNGTIYKEYYKSGTDLGSAVVKLANSTNTNAAYVVVNGISNAVDNGTTFIAKYSLLTLVHTLFEAGATSNTMRIKQLPRMEIESPTDITELENPSTIEIQYGVQWLRWDGLPYASTGTFTESESDLRYVIQYSRDGGTTWLYVQDDTTATPGELPTDTAYIVDDAGAGVETFDWEVPVDDFPEGTYMLRIDCFRNGAQVHYSTHQTRLFIQR